MHQILTTYVLSLTIRIANEQTTNNNNPALLPNQPPQPLQSSAYPLALQL